MPELPFDTEVKRKKMSAQLVPTALGKPGGWVLSVVDGAGGFDWRRPPARQILELLEEPDGVVTAPFRTLAVVGDGTDSTLWQNDDGETAWHQVGGTSFIGGVDNFFDDTGVNVSSTSTFIPWVTGVPPFVANAGRVTPTSTPDEAGLIEVDGEYTVNITLALSNDAATFISAAAQIQRPDTSEVVAVDAAVVETNTTLGVSAKLTMAGPLLADDLIVVVAHQEPGAAADTVVSMIANVHSLA